MHKASEGEEGGAKMARNIVDTADRTVSIPRKFNPKWLLIGLILACVIGGSIGGYFALINNVTPTISIPNPQPVQPNLVPPAVSTPTQPATPTQNPMPVLEVKWEEIKLPPLKFGYDGIVAFFIEDGGKTISVYRCIGPADGGKATRYSLWKTTDGGKTWKELGEEILYPDQEKQRGFIPSERSWSGNASNQYLSEKEILESTPNPLTDLGNPYLVSKDPNNAGNLLVISYYLPSDGSTFTRRDPVYRLFLSTEGRYYQVNFPVCFISFDAYPKTPQLTLLKSFPPAVSIRTISSDDGLIKLFMTDKAPGVFWKATVNLKSPTS
ncbi:MAG: hypothetical protein COX92_00890 [Candidatus Nealsonbacteria bacterium CG_4_10_14_0_2_um_filter_40_15]|uniref:Sialidase domain-containing protein n=1 Tax=Candidatus Nealsonbacteria bacterium CG_4_10_14_0_2_um_filter_40_15 TaxID=1974682 RepID=A0A2M7UUP4_9BACT|nr:MAG: hypothetical protein COX92_00890 [Candidatus Nealsonbacteria bacterium CG_4_10_14_0_2_um_filter_40_15]